MVENRNLLFCIFLIHVINNELVTVDILCVSDKVVIERLPRTIWPQYHLYGQ